MIVGSVDLHISRPSVYLDQWVWIRLAKAASGKPREPYDVGVLTAVQNASTAGVAFPLSSTHYMETSEITSPRQRCDLARTMASISRCRTLRSRRVLLRHQMLHAMHASFGRPTFRPQPPEALGIGVIWALTGEQPPLRLYDLSGQVNASAIPGMQAWLRKANQFIEFQMLAGPRDEEIEDLRRRGYWPESAAKVTGSRLDWEELYVGLLAGDPVSRKELRVRIQAREIFRAP